MRRLARRLLGVLVIAGALLIGFYGLFALLYNADCGRNSSCDVYVTVAGHRKDANLVGWVALALAALTLVLGIWLVRHRDSRSAHHSS